ncbi:MAG: polysaccharide biosynthesis protein [Persephonella sp.]|nr:MAG: polysaccharide biosynthesis protein [Persephonella sp.]
MKIFIRKLFFKPTKTKRAVFFLISDIIIFVFSLYISFLLRFDFDIHHQYEAIFLYYIPIFVISKIFIFWKLGIYQINWRFVGLNDLFKILNSLFIFTVGIFFVNLGLQHWYNKISIPKSVILIDFFVSLSLVLLLRASKRFYIEIFQNKSDGKKALIVGAGNTGERIARELVRSNVYKPIGFVDDDDMKVGTFIHGIKVLGTIKDIPDIIKKYNIQIVIIAIPSLNHKKVREIFNVASNLGVKDIKIVPSIYNLPSNITVKDLKDISIEDLLSREVINIETQKVREFLQGKKIFVSGAGGSIGSEIVKQLLKFDPKLVIAFEIDETELYNLKLDLEKKFKEKNIEFITIVGDIRDFNKIKSLFEIYKPDVVFHAAAYKHVPLMEHFPEEAIKTNVIGTYNLVKASIESGVDKFINISTDKAVNPTSIMGATKRLAEIICTSFNSIGKTKFISVRFGNVLGSRGSVIPIFLEQIKKGGPITVTHPEMKRYFMTIPEAVLLVFQAAAMGKGGEVFVLDMGEPVKIVNLAEALIKIHGLEPYKDIDIIFTGLRPGEKLFEELLTAEEGTLKTYHKKIYIAKISHKYTKDDIENIINMLEAMLHNSSEDIKEFLKGIIPFYKSNEH